MVQSFTAPDGGVCKATLADMMSNQPQPDFEQVKDSFAVQAFFCVGVPGQSPWLQTSAAQGLDHVAGWDITTWLLLTVPTEWVLYCVCHIARLSSYTAAEHPAECRSEQQQKSPHK